MLKNSSKMKYTCIKDTFSENMSLYLCIVLLLKYISLLDNWKRRQKCIKNRKFLLLVLL